MRIAALFERVPAAVWPACDDRIPKRIIRQRADTNSAVRFMEPSDRAHAMKNIVRSSNFITILRQWRCSRSIPARAGYDTVAGEVNRRDTLFARHLGAWPFVLQAERVSRIR
jgi:hypothetical protein